MESVEGVGKYIFDGEKGKLPALRLGLIVLGKTIFD